jgi:glycosyltransferase involved in cell wall biosynthesis
MKTPDISVIIPTYNRISMLKEALDSVFAQEFDGVVEVIVVDDNSQDGTSAVVSQKYPEVRLISLKENVGAYVTRNRALSEAKGKYIAFLDSDDLWEKNYLKSQITALEGKEKYFCVSGLTVWDTRKNQKQTSYQKQKPNLDKYASPIHHLLVLSFISTPSSVVFPRQAFDEVGLFEESFRVGADTDFYIRCLLSGYQAVFTEQPVAIKREHGKDQLTSTKNLKLKEKGKLIRIKKHHPLAKESFVPVSIRRVYAEVHGNFATQYFINNNFFHWFTSLIAAAYNASPGYAFSIAIGNIRYLLKIGTRLRKMYYYIKQLD